MANCIVMSAFVLTGCQTLKSDASKLVEGLVWQLDNNTIETHGNWHEPGAKWLLLQWIAVDGISFLSDHGKVNALRLPGWQRIGEEPLAQEVILGLAGRFDESSARADVAGLIPKSARLTKLPIRLNVVGWYLPVEVDSTCNGAKSLASLLAQLPRQLWIHVYDGANIGAKPFVLVKYVVAVRRRGTFSRWRWCARVYRAHSTAVCRRVAAAIWKRPGQHHCRSLPTQTRQ